MNSKTILIAIAVSLGGFLFGYDTAVISGAISSLKTVLIAPAMESAVYAEQLFFQYKLAVYLSISICVLVVGLMFFKLFSKIKAGAYSALLILIGFFVASESFPQDSDVVSLLSSIHGFAVSSALAGCIIGGSIGGFVSRSIGRKQGLIVSAVMFAVSAVGSSMPEIFAFHEAPAFLSFAMFRILGGMGVGLASMLAPMYIAEIAPAEKRGSLVSINQFAIVSGILIVYFVNYSIASFGDADWVNASGWRWMFASEVVPALLFLLMLQFVPKTPRYSVIQGDENGALSTLNRLSIPNAEMELVNIKLSLKEKSKPWLSYGAGLIFIGIGISVFQQVVGINAILYYAPVIFESMGAGKDAAMLQTVIVGAVNMLFTIVAMKTVDRYGRKPLMIIGASGMAFSMLVLGGMFYFQSMGILTLILILFYIASFSMSWGPVAWVLLSELFPNSIRGAMSVAVAAQWLTNLAVSWTFAILISNEYLLNTFNNAVPYWMYGSFSVLAAVFIWKFVPETKGRSLESLEKIWKKG